MKKLLFSALAVLLAAAMSVTFFACKKNDEPETDASGNTIVKIMVHVAEQSAEGKAYKQVTDSFNVSETAKSNKIKVRVEYKPRSNSATGLRNRTHQHDEQREPSRYHHVRRAQHLELCGRGHFERHYRTYLGRYAVGLF